MKKVKKIFIICPVRNSDEQTDKVLQNYVGKLEEKGYEVHYPPWCTDQNDPIGLRICKDNREALYEADEIHIWFKKGSEGSLFDFGMYFMLLMFVPEKRLVLINKHQVKPTPYKSFANVILELAKK